MCQCLHGDGWLWHAFLPANARTPHHHVLRVNMPTVLLTLRCDRPCQSWQLCKLSHTAAATWPHEQRDAAVDSRHETCLTMTVTTMRMKMHACQQACKKPRIKTVPNPFGHTACGCAVTEEHSAMVMWRLFTAKKSFLYASVCA